ncbi:hypothetical protein [Aquimarina sp. 2201CG5-10]|uniref:hypothetical protein n=1 Tax=Aquimarina callyspongiae TaxID=3098150 RepID=UPI002AB413A7|nr:hypothetical protein [Aquimarina sp. 2201CG5-10]MDY8137780.1 hypothetical protein [Aquimarina sp. 2201CG5-10]
MNLKVWFQKHMFFLVLITYSIFQFILGTRVYFIGINKTVGWGWDFTNLFYFFEFGVWVSFLFGYGIIKFLGLKTQETLSIVHLGIIILSLIIASWNIQFEIVLIIGIISLVVFILNIIKAKKNQNG